MVYFSVARVKIPNCLLACFEIVPGSREPTVQYGNDMWAERRGTSSTRTWHGLNATGRILQGRVTYFGGVHAVVGGHL